MRRNVRNIRVLDKRLQVYQLVVVEQRVVAVIADNLVAIHEVAPSVCPLSFL